MVLPFGVAGPGEFALFRTLGVVGVRGGMHSCVLEELLGVRGALGAGGVDGALVFPDTEVCGDEVAVFLGLDVFPQPSKVLRVILLGWGLDLRLGVFFFSSVVVTEGVSLLRLAWVVGAGVALVGWDPGEEVLPMEDFLAFLSTPLLGTNISSVGGSFRGVPSSPGEKDRKEQ